MQCSEARPLSVRAPRGGTSSKTANRASNASISGGGASCRATEPTRRGGDRGRGGEGVVPLGPEMQDGGEAQLRGEDTRDVAPRDAMRRRDEGSGGGKRYRRQPGKRRVQATQTRQQRRRPMTEAQSGAVDKGDGRRSIMVSSRFVYLLTLRDRERYCNSFSDARMLMSSC